jgi:hypothetical protein
MGRDVYHVRRVTTRGGSLAFRVLLVVAAFVVLYGCGQTSSPVERQEKREGVEQVAQGGEGPPEPSPSPEPTTAEAVGNIPIAERPTTTRRASVPLPSFLLTQSVERSSGARNP